jgi:NRPS condensation-like uncharacterized protein
MKYKKLPLAVDESIYPPTSADDWNLVFRIGFYLKENINADLLKKAVGDIVGRFPTFFSRVENQYSSYCSVRAKNCDIAEKDAGILCRPFDLKDRTKPNMRILYGQKLIAMEIFHALSDGQSAVEFLKTLTARYLELCGKRIEYGADLLDYRAEADARETEDASLVYYEKTYTKRNAPYARQLLNRNGDGFVCVGRNFHVDGIKTAAKKYGITITEYLQAVLHCVLAENTNSDLPAVVQVTASLRRYFPSPTLRNFTLFADIPCPDSCAGVSEVVEATREQYASKTSKEALQNMLNATSCLATQPILKLIPLFAKKKGTRRVYDDALRKYTITLSNLGVVKMPRCLQNEITGAQFMISGMPDKPVNCTAITVNGKMSVFISGKTDFDFASRFFELVGKDVGAFGDNAESE